MELQEACHETGKKLELLKEVIIDHWERLVRESITQSLHEDTIILHDHFGEIIDNLILILKGDKFDEAELGKAHGFHRVILTSFSLQDVLKEYSLFRETIVDYLYPMGDIRCTKLVHKYIDIVLKNSVVEFLKDLQIYTRVLHETPGSEIEELKNNPVISNHKGPNHRDSLLHGN